MNDTVRHMLFGQPERCCPALANRVPSAAGVGRTTFLT
jgi:hypothetical protein